MKLNFFNKKQLKILTPLFQGSFQIANFNKSQNILSIFIDF
jgi:hypothetical protein